MIEFSHRVAATVVVVLIGARRLQAFRRLRDRRLLVRGTIAAGVLVLAQAALGGLTVEHGLHTAGRGPSRPGDAAARPAHHSFAAGADRRPRPPRDDRSRAATADAGHRVAPVGDDRRRWLRRRHRGGGHAGPAVLGAHAPAAGWSAVPDLQRSCPSRTARLVDIQLTHRLLMYLTAIAAIAMTAVALAGGACPAAPSRSPRRCSRSDPARGDERWARQAPGLIVAHLTLATILWATVVYAAAPAGRGAGDARPSAGLRSDRDPGGRSLTIMESATNTGDLVQTAAVDGAADATLAAPRRTALARPLSRSGRLPRPDQAADHLAAAGDTRGDDVRRRPAGPACRPSSG